MSTINELRELIKMVEQSAIQRFEHETTRIVIVKNDGSVEKSIKVDVVSSEEEVSGSLATPNTATGSQPSRQEEAGLHKIASPTMGTYYSTSQPGGEPFVTAGSKVSPTTVVCVLEAMKLFTEITAGVEGEIVEILVKDGDFIEYGQPLFTVKK